MSFNVFRFVFRPVFLKTCMFVHICCNVFHKNTSLSLTFTCLACWLAGWLADWLGWAGLGWAGWAGLAGWLVG